MKILKSLRKYLIILFFVMCPIALSSCDCNFDFDIGNAPKTLSAPYIYADVSNNVIQWYDLEDTDVYEVYINNQRKSTFSVQQNQKDGIVEYNVSSLLKDESKNTIEVVAKNIDRPGYHDSDKSNPIVIDLSVTKTTSTLSNYTFTTNKLINTTTEVADKKNNTLTISWDPIKVASTTYLVRGFSNSTGYFEKIVPYVEGSASKVNTTINNIADHDILIYQISEITGTNTATIVSSKKITYTPDKDYSVVIFDGYVWDYYINSQEELNAIVYYNFLSRSTSYIITFDPAFKTSATEMHSAVEEAFTCFYETSYYETVHLNNYGTIDGQNYKVELDYGNISECNIDLKINTSNLLNKIDTGSQFYLNNNYTKRASDYNNFVSDKYFLTTEVTKSEQLYTAIENKITPIVTPGSRADIIYTEAKRVLREIISDEMSDYEKALSIFDWITYNTVYDYNGSSKSSSYNFTQDCCYYLEGVFLKKVAVCDGFSKAFSLMCNMEGIDCIRIVGDAKTNTGIGGHAWNKVKVDGNYYVVDITWTEIINNSTEYLSHKYFMISEENISETHFPYAKRDKFFAYPTEIIADINYYEQPNFSFKNQNDIFFEDASTTTNVTTIQYIDSSEDLQNSLYTPILNNSRFIEMAVDYDYLLELYGKYSANGATDMLSALQNEMRAVKFSPQLISQIYDTVQVSLTTSSFNFLNFGDGKTATVCIFDTTLLVNEPKDGEGNEFVDILEKFSRYAHTNSDVLYSKTATSETGYVIEVGIDLNYLESELGLPDETTTNFLKQNFQQYFAEYIAKLNTTYDIKCDFEYSFTNKFEDTIINNDVNYSSIGYVNVKITTPWVTTLATPQTQLVDNHILRWTAVDYAEYYKIYNGTTLIATINSVDNQNEYSYALSQTLTESDVYDITVQAYNNSSLYGDSEPSVAVKYIVPSTPIATLSDTTLSWSWDNNATMYIINKGTTPFLTIYKKLDSSNNATYEIYTQGSTTPSTHDTYIIDLANYIKTAGQHDFTITAVINSDYQTNLLSNSSNTVGYYQIDKINYSFDDTTLVWQKVTNATSYQLIYWTTTINNATTITISPTINETNCSFDMTTLNLPANVYHLTIVGTNSAEGYNTGLVNNTITYIKLDAPTITFNSSRDTTLLSWSSIADANSYILYVDGTPDTTAITNTSSSLNSIISEAGTYSIQLIAQNTEDSSTTCAYEQSDPCSAVEYIVLDTPTLTINSRIISWNSINNIDNYYIYINDAMYDTTEEVTYSLEELTTAGEYKINVQSTSMTPGIASSGLSSAKYLTLTKLTTPILSFAGTNLLWESNTNATNFQIYLNSSLYYTASNTSTTLDITYNTPGIHSITAVAKANPTSTYVDSDISRAINYIKLATPTGLNIEDDTLSWNSVSNATAYEIYHGDYNTPIATIPSTSTQSLYLPNYSAYFQENSSVNLWIKAISSANGVRSSENSSIISYTYSSIEKILSSTTVNNIDFVEEIVYWNTVSNAEQYKVYIDNNLIATVQTTQYDLTSHIRDNSTHNIHIIANDTDGEYSDNATYNTYKFARTYADTIQITDTLIVYRNVVLGPSETISSSTISWSEVPFADSYKLVYYNNATGSDANIIMNGINTTYSTKSIDITNTTSSVSVASTLGTSGISGYYLLTELDGMYYIQDFNTNYHNPYTEDFNTVYAFDGELNDYYIESQAELNNLIYYMFENRTSSLKFKTTSTIYNNYDTYISTAINSFFETRNSFNFGYSYSTSGSNYYITQTISFEGNYTIDNEYYNNLSETELANIYSQLNTGISYYEIYNYTGRARSETYNNFASDRNPIRINVSTSEQLMFAIEYGFTPICESGSVAETIYNQAKSILREIISDEMNEYEKSLAIFDWITVNTKYDYYSASSNSSTPMATPCFYLEGVFLHGIAVCDGFSKAYSLMCNMEGIESIRIIGTAQTSSGSGGHAWNKVRVDNKYYVVDITWTDKLLRFSDGTREVMTHQYFLVPDSAISSTHTPHSTRTKFYNYTANTETIYYDKLKFYTDSTRTTLQDISIANETELNNVIDIVKSYNIYYMEVLVDVSYLTSLAPSATSTTDYESALISKITQYYGFSVCDAIIWGTELYPNSSGYIITLICYS